jgi:hypothetical protein
MVAVPKCVEGFAKQTGNFDSLNISHYFRLLVKYYCGLSGFFSIRISIAGIAMAKEIAIRVNPENCELKSLAIFLIFKSEKPTSPIAHITSAKMNTTIKTNIRNIKVFVSFMKLILLFTIWNSKTPNKVGMTMLPNHIKPFQVIQIKIIFPL